MGDCFEGHFAVCINMIQFLGSPCSKSHMMEKEGENLLHVCLVEVPSNNEFSLWMGGLQIADIMMESIEDYLRVCIRRNANSNVNYDRYFSWEIEGSSFDCQNLNVQRTV